MQRRNDGSMPPEKRQKTNDFDGNNDNISMTEDHYIDNNSQSAQSTLKLSLDLNMPPSKAIYTGELITMPDDFIIHDLVIPSLDLVSPSHGIVILNHDKTFYYNSYLTGDGSMKPNTDDSMEDD